MRITKKRTVVTAGLILSLATFGSKPSHAATLAISESIVNISNFSYTSPNIKTAVNTNTFTDVLVNDGTVATNPNATAVANFEPNSDKSALNLSSSVIQGTGSNYFGLAESFASVGINNFTIAKNTTLSFDFAVILSLATAIDTPSTESASAYSNISFEILDQSNDKVLDYLYISGNVSTPDDNDLFNYQNSASISFDNDASLINTSFGGTQENAFAFIQGTYSKTFTEDTILSIRESKFNKVSAQVPEPLSCGGMLLAGLMGLCMKRKQKLEHD